MARGQRLNVLARWPAPWRVAAVLTGVLPVCGVLRGHSPPQYRLCSGPAIISLLLAVVFTAYEFTWLTPKSLGAYQMKNVLLTVLFEFVIGLAMYASAWLMAIRGRRIPDLLSKAGKVLESCSRYRSPRPLKDSLIDIILAVTVACRAVISIWRLCMAGDVLSLGVNSLPKIVQRVYDVIGSLRMMSLLSLNVYLLQTFSEVFDGISVDLERLLRSTTAPHRSQMTRPRSTGGHRRIPVNGASPVRAMSSLSVTTIASLERLPSPPSVANTIADLRARYLAAADATAAFSATYALPSVCVMVHRVTLTMSVLATLSLSPSPPSMLPVAVAWLCIEAVLVSVLLCLYGQRLEEAARRPALLLLRSPPDGGVAAVEAARLVALVDALRPAVGAPGIYSINGRLLVSVAAGFITYMVMLLQTVSL